MARAIQTLLEGMTPVGDLILGIKTYQALFFAGSVKGIWSDGSASFLETYVSEIYGESASKMIGWAGCLLSLLEAVEITLSPVDLSDIEIYNRIDLDRYNAHFRIGNSDLSMERVV